MKIGLAIYNFDPKKGGAERYAYDLSQRLAAKGHDINVFCAHGIETPGITLIPLHASPYPRWLRNLSFALAHKRALLRVRPDVMLGFGNVLELDVYQSHGGVQSVWMEREIASYDSLEERAAKAFFLRNNLNQAIQRLIESYPVKNRRFTRIVAISDMVRDHMSAHYGIEKEKFDIVYNGVDTERFKPHANNREGPFTILFCAGNFRLKGLMPLIRATGRMVREGKDVRLTIMGRGNKNRYQRAISETGIAGLVTFVGEQSAPEEVYRRADILAHPTYYDACSLTTMEGMASGLPVVTTKWNGASIFVSPEEGYVIDEPEDTEALSAALLALTDAKIRDAMGRSARRKMEFFTMERNASMMEEILLQAAQEKRRGN